MKIIKVWQLILISFMVVILTACGGDGNSTNTIIIDKKITKEKAISKIVNFAKTGKEVPTIVDYQSAGVDGVSNENIDKINEIVAKITYTDVDTTAEIQSLVNHLNTEVTPPNNKPKEEPKDKEKPVIKLLGANPLILHQDDTYIEYGATAMDNIDGNITSKIIISSIPDTSKEGNYIVTYMVSDLAGNIASIKREVEVKGYSIAKNTHINEILASNAYTNVDADYSKFSDWIELYNDENHTVDVGGFYLSDKVSEPKKWQIPAGTKIAAKGYLLIWADDKDTVQKALHTNFKLSSKGESIIFSDRDANVIDTVIFNKQKTDISCKKSENNIIFMNPTPAAKNSKSIALLEHSEKPTFSLNGGFYSTSQTLTISAANGATIYYTVDGSIPTENSLTKQPIEIDKSMVIRAKSLESGKFLSEMVTQSYFIDFDSTLPVVSLSTDPKFLYDEMIGIYVTGKNGIPLHTCNKNDMTKHNYAQDWERPVYLSLYDENKKKKFSDELSFEISGQCSRHNKKKSFGFEFDKKYGSRSLTKSSYKLYEMKDLEEIEDFKIRAGNMGYEIADILAAALVVDGNLSVDYQAYRAINMFMNGEYWGVYNIREKKGDEYLISNYPDIDKDKLDIINNSTGVAKAGDKKDYLLLEKAANDKDIQKVKSMIDIDSFIDYMSLMIYSGNQDWIWSNSRAWKRKEVGAQWRWMLDDLDRGFNSTVIDENSFKTIKNRPSTLVKSFFLLLEDANFKTAFKDRFNILLDTLFSPVNMRKQIDKILDERKEYIVQGKWKIEQNRLDKYIQSLYDFADKRSGVVKTQLDAL
jgi:hypothetical protein